MRRFTSILSILAIAASMSGCAYVKGGTDLSDVASRAELENVTTGDGTYENYTATGHYTGTEIGIGIGIPFLITLIELFPGESNENLLTNVAKSAKQDKAEALINVKPSSNTYTGFPFFILGIYVDRAEGTGIDIK
ncbi:hypothetical protein IT570_04630 [Candidatus Sumerlaeota bacterium]|nr:hypothetical protein [Candidatus Sumerlaeota bacterium]